MSKTTAIGLIILFTAIIVGGVLYLVWKDGQKTEIADQFPPAPTKPFEQRRPETTQIPTTDFVQLTEDAVASFSAVENGVRFIERATGNIIETNSTGSSYTTISNTTIPYTFDAQWSFDSAKALVWYRENEQVKIASVESGEKTKGVLLPAETISAVYAPDRNRIFYTIHTGNELVGIVSNPDNTNQIEILRIPFSDFRIDWFTPREISFLLKPTGSANGFLYRYNIDKNSFDKILGEIPGLDIVWSQDGSKIIYSSVDTTTSIPSLFVYDVKKGTATNLNIHTFAQKCAWLNKEDVLCGVPSIIEKGLYPDDWFKGRVQFNDAIARIYTAKNEKTIIKKLPFVDVELLELSLDKKYLYIKNKKDGLLWSLQLPQ